MQQSHEQHREREMHQEIVIVREGEAYRLLHGHLRLFSLLNTTDEVSIHVRGEGLLRVQRSKSDYRIRKDGRQLPLLRG
jgi:hypothetical protein